jgi:fucose 4-O-acetylase-like acetyltransferase
LYKLLALLLFVDLAAATVTSIATALASAICTVKWLVYGLLPTIALVMFLLAGLAYAAGQAFGAETKARAQNWAMSLLVGGVVGIILAIIAPALLSMFVTGTGMAAYATICPA